MNELSPKEKLEAQVLGTALGNTHVLKSLVELISMLKPNMGDALAQRWEKYVNDSKDSPSVEPHLDAIYGYMLDTITECAQTARAGAEDGRAITQNIEG